MRNVVVFGVALCAAGFVQGAVPVVDQSSVTMVQPSSSREVTISYRLTGEPAVVTIDIQTNGCSIGGENLWYFRGDVNKLVQPGETLHKAYWRPDKAWPGHLVQSGVTAVVTAWATNTPPDIMVVSLVAPSNVMYYANAASVPNGITNEMYKTDYLALRKIPAANVIWRMGSPATPAELGRDATKEVPHLVTLANDFYLGVYEVTQAQYLRIAGTNPSSFKDSSDFRIRPVEVVGWNLIRGTTYIWPDDGHQVDETSFLGKLRMFAGHEGFDIPTEAQWEFACRAGVGAALYTGEELSDTRVSDNLEAISRYRQTGLVGGVSGTLPPAGSPAEVGATAKVGSYLPNGYGLYDMIGNVWELCLDWYAADISGCDAEIGPLSGSVRAYRGGAFNTEAQYCRSACRQNGETNIRNFAYGFRIGCTAVGK